MNPVYLNLKTMKTIIYSIFLLLSLTACHEVKVGFLETAEARYKPDVLEVKKVLDPVEDADRIARKFNWVSYPIDGVQGTYPMYMKIYAVRTEESGDTAKFLAETKVRGDGTFDIPFDNEIPAGKYIVTLKVENEGYSAILTDIFTVWVH